MTTAVDSDGTMVTGRYPDIGNEIPFTVETLELLQQEHHRLILWSVHEGRLLDETVAWCKERGVGFYTVNKEYPEQKFQDGGFSRKLRADLSTDNRNMGGLPDWGIIYRVIKEYETYRDVYTSGDDVLKKKEGEWF